MKHTKSLVLMFCFLLTCWNPLGTLAGDVPAQTRDAAGTAQGSDDVAGWNAEIRDLRRRLANSPQTALEFQDKQWAPVTITEATVKFVKRTTAGEPEAGYALYATQLRVRVMNSSPSTVKGIVLEFRSQATTFRLSRYLLTLEPGSSETVLVDLMFVPGEPSALSVTLDGARMADGTLWGSFPVGLSIPSETQLNTRAVAESAAARPPKLSIPPPPPMPKPRSDAAQGYTTNGLPPLDSAVSVDTKPVMLNRPRPSYTELARINHVDGTTRLRVLVGSDGLVSRVVVVRALPDFLTEQAVSTAYEVRFKPATMAGQPVAYWQQMDIEFVIR